MTLQRQRTRWDLVVEFFFCNMDNIQDDLMSLTDGKDAAC